MFINMSLLQSFADPVQVTEIMNTTTEREMTGSLMALLFQRKTIAESSVTGKEGRPALNPEKVQLIICKFKIFLAYIGNANICCNIN